MDTFLIVLSIVLFLVGIAGSVVPALPGIPLSWLGILCLNFVQGIQIPLYITISTLILTVIIVILQYVIPAQGTKRFGGTKYGIWGTNIGLIIGIIAPIPLGFIIGPFLGAYIGELIYNSQQQESDKITDETEEISNNRALKAAFGSFVGIMTSSLISLMFCIVFFCMGLYYIISNMHNISQHF